MMTSQPVLALTPGEPAGIGPEITLKLAQQHPQLSLLAIADPGCLRRAAKSMNINVDLVEWEPGMDVPCGKLACLPVPLASEEKPGFADPQNANYILNTLRRAVELEREGFAAAILTGPVNKASINQSGLAFSGHTEFLAELAGVEQVVMMLAAPGLRVALVTTHLPLREVADAVTAQKLQSVIEITARELRQKFGISRPRLQVLGLNPHAGEQGHLGTEDDMIIRPVIERMQSANLTIVGPVPADTAFTPPRLAVCDAVIAMYHDQGLPVLKHFGFGSSVNITLGLPFIRTSVDHGTALDIAGSGKADAGSFYHAAKLALEMAQRIKPQTGSAGD
jgi:4-hydroxythreonine-4-phosphate dehydrogenase